MVCPQSDHSCMGMISLFPLYPRSRFTGGSGSGSMDWISSTVVCISLCRVSTRTLYQGLYAAVFSDGFLWGGHSCSKVENRFRSMEEQEDSGKVRNIKQSAKDFFSFNSPNKLVVCTNPCTKYNSLLRKESKSSIIYLSKKQGGGMPVPEIYTKILEVIHYA